MKPVGSTTLQVWDGKANVDKIKNFVNGPVNVNWEIKKLSWLFRYKTTAPTAVPGKARWEMSRAPFPPWAAWKAVPGFGYTGTTGGNQFSIDLNAYAPRPPGWVKTGSVGTGAPVITQAKGVGQSGGSSPTSSPVLGMPKDLQPPKPKAGGVMPTKIPSALPASLSLYVRVVPLDAAGQDADLPSNYVELHFGPPEAAPPFNMDPKVWPKIALVTNRPIQGYTFDYQCWWRAAKDIKVNQIDGTPITIIKKGHLTNSCDDDDGGIVDDFIDAVGGFVDMLADFVNGVSSAFASIKDFAASTIASAIPGCSGNSLCEGAVMMGINTGLVALGMPPDLPDFEQLQAMGEDYLAETIAQQVAASTGLPGADIATKAAVKKMIDDAKAAAQSGAGSTWIPDDGRIYKPMLIIVTASNPEATPSAAMYLELSEPGGTHYNTSTVPVPSLDPGQSLKIAIALTPVDDPKAWMDLLPTAADYQTVNLAPVIEKSKAAEAALNEWRAKYLSGMVNFSARLTLPPFVGKSIWQTTCFADKTGCVLP